MLKNTEKSKRLALFIEAVKDAQEAAKHLKEWAHLQANQIKREINKHKTSTKTERLKQATDAQHFAAYVLEALPICLKTALTDYKTKGMTGELIALHALKVRHLLDAMAEHFTTLNI